MTKNEIQQINNIVEELNYQYDVDKTTYGFIKNTRLMLMKDDVTFDEVKQEIKVMSTRLKEEEENNTW